MVVGTVGASGVTGPGLQALLGSFTFNNDGAVGSNQSFTLNGLAEGQYYELRLYARKWDNSTQRQQTIKFISGEITDTVTFSEDHPENRARQHGITGPGLLYQLQIHRR